MIEIDKKCLMTFKGQKKTPKKDLETVEFFILENKVMLSKNVNSKNVFLNIIYILQWVVGHRANSAPWKNLFSTVQCSIRYQ